MKKVLLILCISLLTILAGCGPAKYDTFAQCLTEKGVKMYGAFWCPHCADQKRGFGSSFDKIDYIECSLPDRSGQTQVCIQAGIEGYPTWEFADGERQTGFVPMETLAERSGCPLPQ